MENTGIKQISARISYIPACQDPLSSDIGIVYGDSRTYLYDVGSTVPDLEYLNSFSKPPVIAISHFHADHTWWLTEHHRGDKDVTPDDEISLSYQRPAFAELYVSAQTARYVKGGTVVSREVRIDDGVSIRIMPVPSSHVRGALGMMIDDSYLFLGDAAYTCSKGYNVQLLKDLIDFLKGVPADMVMLSHDRRFVRPKEVLIRQLEICYSRRVQGEPYIKV